MKAQLRTDVKSMYKKIDNCIHDIVKARIEHDEIAEGRAMFQMESLMCETLEFYGWMLDNCNFNEDEKTLV